MKSRTIRPRTPPASSRRWASGGLIGRKDIGHPRRENSGFREVPEIGQTCRIGQRAPDPDRKYGDAPFARTFPAADNGEATSVADRRQHELMEQRTVDDAIYSAGSDLADPRGDVITPTNDLVCAEARDELFVR